jgi:chromosome segregation ATPase
MMPADTEPRTLEFAETMSKDQPAAPLPALETARDVEPVFPDDDVQQIETQIADLWRVLDEVIARFAAQRQKQEERLREAENAYAQSQQKANREIARLLDNKAVLTVALHREHDLVKEHQAAVRRFMSVSGDAFGSEVASLSEPIDFLGFARRRIRELERELDQTEVAFNDLSARMAALQERTVRAVLARWRRAWRGMWRGASARLGMRRSAPPRRYSTSR